MITPKNETEKKPHPLAWYEEGLRFECTQCGRCCTGGPGLVFVSEEETSSMAQFLKITDDLFKRKYLRRRENRLALVERKTENKECIFLKDNRCEVYQARPQQCRTFPWWKENLKSEESWKAAASFCEGIHPSAPLVSFQEIQIALKSNKTS